MQEQELLHHYLRYGYVLIRGAISEEYVNRLRNVLNQEYGRPEYFQQQKTINTPRAFALKDVYMVPVAKDIVDAAKSLFGTSYVLIPDLNVQKNACGGWHVDSGSEIPSRYLLAQDYRFAKCGVYLQGNTREWGGGIDLLPRGHKFPVPFIGSRYAHKLKGFTNRLGTKLFPITVDIKAGDMLVFDSRVPHKATYPQAMKNGSIVGNQIQDVPFEKTKYAIYWDVCSKLSEARDHLENSTRRSRSEGFFAEYLALKFPDSFPGDFVSAVQQAGVQIATSALLSSAP